MSLYKSYLYILLLTAAAKPTQHYTHSSAFVVKGLMPYESIFSFPFNLGADKFL